MTTSWNLGGLAYVQTLDLGPLGGEGYTLHLVREGAEGPRYLLQLWQPRPQSGDMDRLRELSLLRYADAEPQDPVRLRFGHSESLAWFLQELQGTPIARFWPELSRGQREHFRAHLGGLLLRGPSDRLPHPELLGVKPGRLVIPRVLGHHPLEASYLDTWYPQGGRDEDDAPWLLQDPPELSEDCARPIRGRSQELTYLKSLMLGLSAPSPMERVTLLLGEEGLGQERLAQFCAGAAETEAFRVARLEIRHGERAGTFLNRLLKELLRGMEADFYAARPSEARILARRFESYAFLRGASQGVLSTGPLEAPELDAVLAALEYATERTPFLACITSLERGEDELGDCATQLCLRSTSPWLFCCAQTSATPALRSALGALRTDPNVATVTLNRLDDRDLRQVLEDILDPNALPESHKADLCQASLGNPGLLQSILELAQLEGDLIWVDGAWRLPEGSDGPVRIHEDMVERILRGRIQRLTAPAAAVLRNLALADHPLDLDTLGRSLGLAGEPLEDLVHLVEGTRLAALKDGWVDLAEPRIRDLALSTAAPAELKRMARSLLKALQETGGRPVLSVRLQSIAHDPGTALAGLMEALEQEPPDPAEAHHVVQQALQLDPAPMQASRLWEFLADAWACGPPLGDPGEGIGEDRSPWEMALEAMASALAALEADPGGDDEDRGPRRARLLRKRAFLELRLQNLAGARQSIHLAAQCLADHPLHPEQPRLRLALGRLHILSGYVNKGIKALEEGLQTLGILGPGADRRDQVALLLELGRAQALRCQFQRGLSTLQSAQRLLEHDQDYRHLVPVLESLARIYLVQGQTDLAYNCHREALHAARLREPWEPLARCHLFLGVFRSSQHHLGPALSHLDNALERFVRSADRIYARQARLWKARTLAALGDSIHSELLALQALSSCDETPGPGDLGERSFLQAEMAGFQFAWKDAVRLYETAAAHFESAGHMWRERLARLRHIQAEARALPPGERAEGLEGAWQALEAMKGPAEASGSRWLEMEWHRAHALLLTDPEATDALASEALMAWGEVLAAAREMRFPAVAMEASTRCADLLAHRGEKLGARSCLQDALSSFQEMWCWVPEAYETAFLGRMDMHQFHLAVESAGLAWSLPERADPLADWTPTQLSLPLASAGRHPR